ncbi:hypothetical protein NE237_028990 [Protea cynaroides]|uniref:Arf-GAP domain-containing protein n=1 Tax=Protea cynaroides TaxID=273540 RepID=A0A9Q0JVT7_9MAGN|nr:hypothetical protein NE237_028990 [Protea cynaroides]
MRVKSRFELQHRFLVERGKDQAENPTRAGCLDCSGEHRGLTAHLSFVCSVTMDLWSKLQLKKKILAAQRKNKNLEIHHLRAAIKIWIVSKEETEKKQTSLLVFSLWVTLKQLDDKTTQQMNPHSNLKSSLFIVVNLSDPLLLESAPSSNHKLPFPNKTILKAEQLRPFEITMEIIERRSR